MDRNFYELVMRKQAAVERINTIDGLLKQARLYISIPNAENDRRYAEKMRRIEREHEERERRIAEYKRRKKEKDKLARDITPIISSVVDPMIHIQNIDMNEQVNRVYRTGVGAFGGGALGAGLGYGAGHLTGIDPALLAIFGGLGGAAAGASFGNHNRF